MSQSTLSYLSAFVSILFKCIFSVSMCLIYLSIWEFLIFIKCFGSECNQPPLFAAPLAFEQWASYLKPHKGIQLSLCLWYNNASSFLGNPSHILVSLGQCHFYSDPSLILVSRPAMPRNFSLCSIHEYIFLMLLRWVIKLKILRIVLTLRNTNCICFKTLLYGVNYFNKN